MLGAERSNGHTLYYAYRIVAGKNLPTRPETLTYAQQLIELAELRNNPHGLFYTAELAWRCGNFGQARFYYTLAREYSDPNSAVAFVAELRQKELARDRKVIIEDSF